MRRREGAGRALVVVVVAASSLFGVAPSHGSAPSGAAVAGEGRIAYTSLDEDGARSIWTVLPDGTDPRVVVREGDPYDAIWSPDGSRFAYVSKHLFVADADGSNVTRLTSRRTDGPGRVVLTFKAVSWSPDGTRLAFAYGGGSHAAIVVVSVDGSSRRRLTDAEALAIAPRWSPDGRRIVYLRARKGRAQIATMRPNGDDKVRLAQGDGVGPASTGPSWSADGLRIAFTRANEADRSNDLFVMNRDGTDKQLLATGLPQHWGVVKWSPDGSRIAFLRAVDGRYRVMTIAPDGTGERQVTSGASDPIDFVWSPSGEHIAYGTGAGEVLVTSADGTSTRTIASDPSRRSGLPDWQPSPAP